MLLSRFYKHYRRFYLPLKSFHDILFWFILFILGFSLGVHQTISFINDNYSCLPL